MGYRSDVHIIPGINIVVLDVDGGIQMNTAKLLLKEYKFLMYSTKRSTLDNNRFRLIMPLSHEVKLTKNDFKEFMHSIYNWLPFKVDDHTTDRCRKWLTNKGDYYYNEGLMLDSFMFIPKTKKCEEHKQKIDSQQSMDNTERWFLNNTTSGNRNNMLLRFGLILVDSGFNSSVIENRLKEFNNKLPKPINEMELTNTVLVTINNKINTRG